MNITWLFGNGLDLGFGLNTRYTDFYEYLQKSDRIDESNIIYKELSKDYRNGDYELWSDYENRLGVITKDFTSEHIDTFTNDKIALDLLLNEYLLQENNKISLTDEDKREILLHSIPDIVKDTKKVERDKMINLLRNYQHDNFFIKPISFNYTNTVSLLWSVKNEMFKNVRIDQMPISPYRCILKQPFYLHGTLDNSEMIVGVNDDSQILNKEFRSLKNVKDAFIKKNLLNIAGQGNFQEFIQIIKNSTIICLYGLSIGETDRDYWVEIKKRLLGENVLCLIYEHDSRYQPSHIILEENKRTEIKERFYKNSNTNEQEKRIIDSKILVEINHDIFTPVNSKGLE